MRQRLLDLAASADVRVQVVATITQPHLPDPPLYLFGDDSAHLASAIPHDAHAVIIHLDAPQPNRPGATTPTYSLNGQEREVLQALTRAANAADRQGTVILVEGITGGAGATVAALLLAATYAGSNHNTFLVESGRTQATIELALGLENTTGTRWPDLTLPSGDLVDSPNPQALEAALLRWRSLGILAQRAGASSPGLTTVAEVVTGLARAPGIVILDGGAQAGASAWEAVGLRADICVWVVPRTVAAVVNAHGALENIRGRSPLILTRGSAGGVLSQRDVQRALDARIVGELPDIPRLQALLDRGRGLPGPRARCWAPMEVLASKILAQISAQPRSQRLERVLVS